MIEKIIKKKIILIFFVPMLITFFIIFLILLVCDTSSKSNEMIDDKTFYISFSDNVNYYVSSDFGYRINPVGKGETKFHTGIDLVAPSDTDILASASGQVIKTGYDKNAFGNYVYIKHNIDKKIYYTAYGHMKDNSIVVKVGDNVSAKDKIGVIGATGNVTGIHLHFSIMSPNPNLTKDNLVDPKELIKNIK